MTIHYHGTPIGGPKSEAGRFLVGRHALVSFANPQDMRIVADVCQSFCLDNGAFTAWSRGDDLDVPGYIRWVEHWRRHPGFDWCLIPDTIDGSELDNDRMIAEWPLKQIGVPVWHLHEPIDRLVRLCDQFTRVAFGSSGAYSSPGSRQWWTRMADALDAICDDDGHLPCKLHGLRMMDPEIFTHIPFSSVDSTNAAQNSGATTRFGQYVPPTASQRAAVIADRIEMHNSPPVWVRSMSQAAFALEVMKCLK